MHFSVNRRFIINHHLYLHGSFLWKNSEWFSNNTSLIISVSYLESYYPSSVDRKIISQKGQTHIYLSYIREVKWGSFRSETSFSPFHLTTGPTQYWSILWFDHRPIVLQRWPPCYYFYRSINKGKNINFLSVVTVHKRHRYN